MLKLALPLAVMMAVSGVASANEAEDFKDGIVSLAPGEWKWEYKVDLAGFPIEEDNQECLPEDMSRMSVQDIMNEVVAGLPDLVRPSCIVESISPNADGFDFGMSCKGVFSGDVEGKYIRTSDKEAQLTAAGGVGYDSSGKRAFSISANAVHQGACAS